MKHYRKLARLAAAPSVTESGHTLHVHRLHHNILCPNPRKPLDFVAARSASTAYYVGMRKRKPKPVRPEVGRFYFLEAAVKTPGDMPVVYGTCVTVERLGAPGRCQVRVTDAKSPVDDAVLWIDDDVILEPLCK